MRTGRAIRACAEWLVFCLRIGWKTDQLVSLERLWWQCHDDRGHVLPPDITVGIKAEER